MTRRFLETHMHTLNNCKAQPVLFPLRNSGYIIASS